MNARAALSSGRLSALLFVTHVVWAGLPACWGPATPAAWCSRPRVPDQPEPIDVTADGYVFAEREVPCNQ